MTPAGGARVLLAGASGFIGGPLVAALTESGREVHRLVRRPSTGPLEHRWDPDSGRLPDEALDGVDTVIVLSGVGVGDRRWTPAYRQAILQTRTGPVGLVANRLAALGSGARLLAASAVGYYGDRGDERLIENAGPGDGFLAGVCTQWEAAADPAREAGLAVAHLRTGIVLDRSGGALGRLLPLVRLGVAGPLGSGRQWWPWITLTDEIRAIVHLVSSEVVGPVNLVSPTPERNRDLTRALAAALRRPAVVPVPAFALRIALGGFADDLLASQRVLPEALLADGFRFTHPTLSDAVTHVLT